MKGAVLAILADTPAAHAIGGFKVGVGFALRPCRDCLATKTNMKEKVNICVFVFFVIQVYLQFCENEFLLRTPATYDYHCSLLCGPLAEADSVTYGVNYHSVLNDLVYFHVANNQLPQDVMHVLLEGVVPYTIKCLLRSLICDKKYLTLNLLNERIYCFGYSRIESRNKPCELKDSVLNEGNLGQTGQLITYVEKF